MSAATGAVSGPATATATAERIAAPGGGLRFPIAPRPVCEVLDNFGGFSKVKGGPGHLGVDIGASLGQAVYAVEDGVLDRRFDGGSPGLGWGLWGDSDIRYRYYHLSAFAEGLAVGDRVAAGDVIGYVGDTGNAAPGGWHLHFELRPGPGHEPVDPVPSLAIPSICNVY